MEEFDLYGDLELLHAEEKQNAIEDLKWKDKYKVALITIEKLQADNKDLKKKIKHLEINFASLFDTARTEIKRKDNLICELRKQKDDICFRRSKPQFSGKQYDEHSDVRRAASSESIHVNPFSRQARKANTPNSDGSKPFLDEKLPSIYENGKRKHEAPRDVSHETDESRGRRRDRSEDDRVENQDRRRDRSKDERDERRERRRDRSQDDRIESQDRLTVHSKVERDERRERRRDRSQDDRVESQDRRRDRSNDDIDENRGRHKNRLKDDKDESRERHRDSYRSKNERDESQDIYRNRSKDDKDGSREKQTNPSKDYRDESHERHRESYRLKDEQDERRRNRSKDRSRHRNRSRDRVDEERSRQRCDDRYDIKNRDRLEDGKSDRSKERSDRKKEKKSDKKQKRHERDVSQTRSSDSSWDKHAKVHCHSLPMNYTNDEKTNVSSNKFEPTKHEEKPNDSFKSNTGDPPKDITNGSKTDMNQLKNVVPCPNDSEKQRENSKIEILQIEILKDVKEFKKNKLKAEKIPKPDPVNPADVAIEKSNQFLEALFDDSIMNRSQEPNNDLYDDLLTSNHQPSDSIPESSKKESHLLKDENCNLNFHTPAQRKSNAKLLDDLFGPSPAGSLCPAVSSQSSNKSVGASPSDSDFVLIAKPVEESQKDEITQLTTLPKVPLVEEIVIDDSCNQNDEKINKECSEMKPPTKPASVGFKQSDSENDTKKFSKIDENCNFKQQTPQKQVSSNLMDDLFGPSPGSSVRVQKNSVTSMDESSSDFYFEPTVSRVDEKNQEPRKSLSKIPIDGSSSDNVQSYNEKSQAIEADETVVPCSSENTTKGNIPSNNTKTFKFVELDSSFYSSDDEINVDSIVENCKSTRAEVESPPFENITPLKNIEKLENVSSEEEESNVLSNSDENLSQSNCVQSTTESETKKAKCNSKVKHKTKRDNFEKERKKDSKTCHYSSERNKESDKDDSNEDSFSSKHRSDKSQHRSRSEKERKRHRHDHHYHHRSNKEHSKESSHTKSHSSSHNGVSRKRDKNHRDRNERENREKYDLISSKNEVPKSRSSPLFLYYDDDSAKDSLQNQKTADSDQVFFLHCDDISSDDDSIGNESNSANDKNKQNNSKEKLTDEIELNRNTIDIEKPQITNDFESNKEVADTFESDDKEVNSNVLSKHEDRMETECNVLTLEPESQNKDLGLENVKETSSSTIEENPAACAFVDTSICDIKLKSNKITNDDATHCSEDVCDVNNDQQFSEHHESIQKYSTKENDDIEIQNIENVQTNVDNSNESKEQEKSENHIEDQVTHTNSLKTDEKMSLDEGSSGAENFCSVEMESEHENIHKNEGHSDLLNSINSLGPTSHHDEINNSPNVPDTKQSTIEENDKHSPLDDDKIEKDLNSNGEASGNNFENSTPDEELRTCIAEPVSIQDVSGNNFENVTPHEDLKTCIAERVSVENSSDIQLLAIDSDKSAQEAALPIDDIQSQTNSQEITFLNSNKSTELSPKKTDINKEEHFTNLPVEQISETTTTIITTTNDAASCSNSAEFPSSHVSPLKLHNSADELESLHSNSSLVSSGRRRKIKTPRKRTDVCLYKNDSNRIMTMISDRYATSNQVSCLVESDSSLLSAEGPFKPHSPNKDTGCLKQNEISAIEDSKGTLKNVEKQEDQKPEYSSKEILYDSNNQNKSLPSLSSTEELPTGLPNLDDMPLNLCSNPNHEKKEKHGLSTSFSPSTVKEILVKNSEEVCRNSEKTENVHTKSSAEKEKPLDTGLYQEEKNKEDQANENILESHSITIKRNRSKKKVITNPTEIVEKTFETSEDVNVKNNTPYSELIKQIETKNIKVGFNDNLNFDYLKETNKVFDKFCTSSAILASSGSISTLTQQQNTQHQMMKHFMDSDHSFVGTCEYPAGIYCDEVLEIKPKQKTAKRGRPRKNPSVDNIDSELKKKSTESSSASETTKVTVKRKYTKKAKKIPDTSSKSNEEVFNSRISKESKILSNDVDNNQDSSKTLEHFQLDEPCDYPSAINSGEIVETKLNETSVKKKRRKSTTTTLENSESLCDVLKSQVKRKYNKKNRQILDSSNSNEDLEATSSILSQETITVPKDQDEDENKQKTIGDIKSIESKEPVKKRKYKMTNLNSSSDSNKSDKLNENPSFLNPLGSTIHSEKVLDQIHILPPTDDRVDEIPPSCNETTDQPSEKSSTTLSDEKELNQTIGCSLNNSISGEEKDHDSCINKNKKTKKQRKRKLSRSSDTKSDELIVEAKRSKNSPTNTSRPLIEASCPVSGESVQPESIKQQHQRSPRCTENSVSIALTPTHHKIFLNDVFPNDPPPVYKANDDDLQYHEIDDRLRSMFQSPSYTPSSNVELPIEKVNDDVDINVTCEGNLTVEETLNESENILVDETLDQSETTKCDISAGSRKVMLGSNEYVIESIGSHTANVFITRKKSKKRTKSVAATSVV
ncbi:protein PF3D7_1417600 [Eupeodes corollae]|uniref:protein PF3D7_1417600 n=1 Tax=Eupeodes corollae TaxID=290404 RepID=UPI0024908351|nr:protein PF3D7_1417600 [Eupeodes corollae]